MKIEKVSWVIKTSKLCNLRCSYCYEFPYLGDSTRMSLKDLENMFKHIADFYRGEKKILDFVWHGGEPLLINPDYYWNIKKLQHDVFDDANIPFQNSVQTNLTILNEQIIELLKNFFDNVGVSIDLFGNLRRDINGNESESLVIKNMQRLTDNGIPFGCITVLSKFNVSHLDEICQFFDDIDVGFRLLPIYRTGFVNQQDGLALSDTEIVSAFKKIVDIWFSSKGNLSVNPIDDYMAHVLYLIEGKVRDRYYNKLNDEYAYIVEPDGSVFSHADPLEAGFCHGNIFKESLIQLKTSREYHKAVEEANQRMLQACSQCRYWGACPGVYMAEATPDERRIDEYGKLKCSIAKPLQEYIEQKLNDGQRDGGRIKLTSKKSAKLIHHN